MKIWKVFKRTLLFEKSKVQAEYMVNNFLYKGGEE